MAVTFNARRNLFVLTAAADVIPGELRPKYCAWYATGATVGTDLLHIREPVGLAELWADVAEQIQFMKIILLPDIISGFEISVLGAGHVILCLRGGDEGGPRS
jgi:hypothetical protein